MAARPNTHSTARGTTHMPDEKYTRTNPRHRIMVEYTAYGKTAKDIADATGYAEAYVKAVQRSPLFQSEVAATQGDIKRSTLATFAEQLAAEAMPSLLTLTSVRDNTNARDTDRVSAADKIIGRTLDLYMPKSARDNDGKRSVKLVIEGGDLGMLANAIREADGRPTIEAQAATDAQLAIGEAAMPDDGIVRPVTIEQVMAEDTHDDGDRW